MAWAGRGHLRLPGITLTPLWWAPHVVNLHTGYWWQRGGALAGGPALAHLRALRPQALLAPLQPLGRRPTQATCCPGASGCGHAGASSLAHQGKPSTRCLGAEQECSSSEPLPVPVRCWLPCSGCLPTKTWPGPRKKVHLEHDCGLDTEPAYARALDRWLPRAGAWRYMWAWGPLHGHSWHGA